MPVTHWIYPTNARSSHYLDNPDGDTEVSPQRLIEGIEQRPDHVDAWFLTTAYRTMRPGDAIWIYAARPHQYMCALAQTLEIYFDEGDGSWYASLLWNLRATRALMQDRIPLSEFGQAPQQPCRANTTTLTVLNQWLRSHRIQLVDLDGEPAPGSTEDTRLRTMRNMIQRQGQPAFRRQLLDAYSRRCAVTGVGVEEVLEAAHIEPYRGRCSNDVTNGILLRADLHTLFDLHLIGVDQHGNLVVSSKLEGSRYARLQGRPLRLPRRVAERPSKGSLAAHLRLLA